MWGHLNPVNGISRQRTQSVVYFNLLVRFTHRQFCWRPVLYQLLLVAMPAVVSLIDNGTLAAITAFILAGLAAGYLLGGPKPENRTVLALTTVSSHPVVA